ncbi:ABC transporter ATP-binding protein [Candidatus Bathyarchaeota archaeon]|nr:MAG: ABC transporter ATP-binding protein [Candidatus Bathyarchaeota archaeon]
MATAIKIDDLWVRYRDEEDYAVKGLSLRIDEGEFVILMGPSGCGKTTLCYTILGIIPRVIKAEVKGNIKVFDINPLTASPTEISKYAAIVFQNPEMQLVTTSVYEEIAFPLENFGLSPDEIEKRAREVLEIAGLSGLEDRSPVSLSGGQKQALAIASVLALRPRVMILDEPTSQLDPQGTKRVTDLILKLREEFDTTILAVEHRIEWAVEHVDRIIVMRDGKIVLDGDPKTIFSREINPERVGFRPPQVSEIAYNLIRRGVNLSMIPISLNEASKIFGGILSEGKADS